MPFKNVASIKQVATVEGAVTGGAYNKALSAVAMASNNPVQVALLPLNGVNPKIQSVGLDAVTEIAYLNRAMAIVKTADAVWALLDIEHKPKIEELHQDSKALVTKSTGGMALGLRWDGKGLEYLPGKGDVAVREFAIRGDTKCADVGETECYAVTEGGDGEFRIHPGSTPEQGSTAKIALPPGSGKLDRVKGGKFFSVVYKRGNPNIVCVRRAGNRLEAKAVTMPFPPTDIVVAETSMIAMAADGRVVLFDAVAVDKATASNIQPTWEGPIGCRGEPTVCVVAHHWLYMGTSTGEIFMGQIVRKSAVTV